MITWFDSLVYEGMMLFMSPWLTEIARVITRFGDIIVLLIICIALLAISGLRKSYGLPVTMSVMVAAGLNYAVKHAVARPRPDTLQLITETGYSFPSGHAMISAAFYITLILIIWRRWECSRRRTAIIMLCGILTLLIGLSRVYLGVHYMSDILVGWFLGFLIAYIISIAAETMSNLQGMR